MLQEIIPNVQAQLNLCKHFSGSNISSIVNDSSTIMQHIDNSMLVQKQINKSSDDLQLRLMKLREKLATLKSKIAEVSFTKEVIISVLFPKLLLYVKFFL